MVKVVQLEKTCSACPAQWEGRDDQGQYVYIRYRWGHLRVEVNRVEIFGEVLGDNFDGSLDYEALKQVLKEIVDFSVYEAQN
jgi:hypothetical protein